MKRYETFVRAADDLAEGRVALFIRDLTPGKRKYNASHVLANLSRTLTPNSAELMVRTGTGTAYADRWYIDILETLPNYVEGAPYGEILRRL